MQIKAYDLVQFMGMHSQSYYHNCWLNSCAIGEIFVKNFAKNLAAFLLNFCYATVFVTKFIEIKNESSTIV